MLYYYLVLLRIKKELKFVHAQYDPRYILGYLKTWGTPLIFLLVYPLLQYLDIVKIFFQCITCLLLILNSNLHWLKYIWCKKSIEQDFTLCALFAFFFSCSVYQDYFFVNFTDHSVPLLLESAVSLSFGQLFILIGKFSDIVE